MTRGGKERDEPVVRQVGQDGREREAKDWKGEDED